MNSKSSPRSPEFTNHHDCCGLSAVIFIVRFGWMLPHTLANCNKYLLIIVFGATCKKHGLILCKFLATRIFGKSQTGKLSQVSSQ